MENKVLAKVNGKDITIEHVNQLITQMGPQRAQQLNTEQGRQQVLQELINQNLLLADAVDEKLNETREFRAELARMTDAIMVQVNVQQILGSAKVNDEEAKEFYEANKAHYNQPEQADTSHILVADEAKASELYEQIMKDEITFETAAKENSTCPSKDKGGSLGMFQRGSMVPEFEEAAFNMAIGQMSKPVKTQFGYHIIRLNNKVEGKESTFEEVKAHVVNEALQQKQRNTYMKKIKELEGKYSVEIMEK